METSGETESMSSQEDFPASLSPPLASAGVPTTIETCGPKPSGSFAKAGDIDIDPNDGDLAAQLVGIKWKPNSRGLIQISPKRKLGGLRNIDEKNELAPIPSPDNADALAYCAMQKAVVRKSTGKFLWIA